MGYHVYDTSSFHLHPQCSKDVMQPTAGNEKKSQRLDLVICQYY